MQPSPTEQSSIHPILQFYSVSVHLSPVKHALQKQIPFVVQDEFVDPCTLQLQAKNHIKFCYLGFRIYPILYFETRKNIFFVVEVLKTIKSCQKTVQIERS